MSVDSKKQRGAEASSLGEVVVNGVHAELFVCDGIALARFSSHPDDYAAAYLKNLSVTSNVFLLVAFRLYLDRQNSVTPVQHGVRPLQG